MAAQKPPAVKPTLKSAPKIRQLYWCAFPKDAQLPEFWKTRPVMIVSLKNQLHDAVNIIPCTTVDQTGNKWAYRLSISITNETSWAICDKISTVAVSRLQMPNQGVIRVPENDLDEILKRLWTRLPSRPSIAQP